MRNAADQAVPLAKMTPHRVVREFYEQFIAYARAYSDAIPTYTPLDNHLAGVAGASTSVLVVLVRCNYLWFRSSPCALGCSTCTAVRGRVAQPIPAILSDSSHPLIQLVPSGIRLLEKFDADSAAWVALDPDIPASEWNAEQRAIIDAVIPVMKELADNVENSAGVAPIRLFRISQCLLHSIAERMSTALPTYTPADSYLSDGLAKAAARHLPRL